MNALATTYPHQAQLMPSLQEWTMMKDQAALLIESGFLPSSIRKPAQAIAIMLKGREMGIPPMQAFAHIHIINGKPCISAELMMALIFKHVPGARIHIQETTADICRIAVNRPGHPATMFTFSMEDARKADLLGKSVWKQYTRAMLRSRCVSEMARAVFPDALMGCSYTPEEMGAPVDDDGNVVEDSATPAPSLREAQAVEVEAPKAAKAQSAIDAAAQSLKADLAKPNRVAKVREALSDTPIRDHLDQLDTPKPTTASIYDDGDTEMQAKLDRILKTQNVDKTHWRAIGKLLHGLPSTDLKDVINEVLTQ
jgi:hypothetical protein